MVIRMTGDGFNSALVFLGSHWGIVFWDLWRQIVGFLFCICIGMGR